MLIRTDTLLPWNIKDRLGGILYPRNIEKVWTTAELAEIGLVKMIPMPLPDGWRRTGPSEYFIDGTEVYPTELIPPPTQAELDAEREFETIQILDENPILGKILFNLAKETRPNLQPAQFKAWVRGLT